MMNDELRSEMMNDELWKHDLIEVAKLTYEEIRARNQRDFVRVKEALGLTEEDTHALYERANTPLPNWANRTKQAIINKARRR